MRQHGTGHGFGSFLTVHEGEHGFSSNVPLMPGHVITNEPGFCTSLIFFSLYLQWSHLRKNIDVDGKWGVRVESALVVKRVKTKQEFGGDTWLGFERLTCVPIQTRMIKESLLTKEEKSWLKDHNQKCWDILSPLLREDKVALKWLRKEADRGIGLPGSGPGGLTVEWD
jgi:Xaa-Pro aminopeptidase